MNEVTRKILFKINRFFNIRLPSDPYISGDTFRKLADIKIDNVNDLLKVRDARNGTIIFCATDILEIFVEKTLPTLKNKFTLITHNSDYIIDQKYLSLVNHELLIHWFAQNNTISHKKITSIPIGLENRLYHNNGRPSKFNERAGIKKLNNNKILCSFSVRTNPTEREPALKILRSSSFVDVAYAKTESYIDLLSNYAFVVSPQGNGVDCHRTWEALYLGVIPIVRGNEFYRKFPRFPGLVLNQWEDLLKYDSNSLSEAYAVCRNKLFGAEFIWMSYWKKKINDTRDMSKMLG